MKTQTVFTRLSLLVALMGSVLAGGVLVAGCGDGLTTERSNDINLEPPHDAKLIFPRTLIGRSSFKAVKIYQAGEASLTIKEIYIEGAEQCDKVLQGVGEGDDLPAAVDTTCEFIIDTRPELPMTLEDGEFKDVKLRYRSTGTAAAAPTRLVIITNALGKEEQWVNIEVQAAAPRIFADPPNVLFQGQAENQQTTLFIKNQGTGPLEVTAISAPDVRTQRALGPNGETIEEIQMFPLHEPPWIIEAGDAETIDISYLPADDIADTAVVFIDSNDPLTPRLEVMITSAATEGLLNVTPNRLLFENVPAGGEGEGLITLSNSGLSPIRVKSMKVIDASGGVSADYRLGADPTDFQLAAGRTIDRSIFYRPTTIDGADGVLVISANADNLVEADPENEGFFLLRVPMVRDGAALPPLVAVSPAAIDFSHVAFGADDSRTVTITNTGGQPLTLSAVRMSTAADAGFVATDPEFSLTGDGANIVVAPGASHEVQIGFARGAEDRLQHIGFLLVETSDGEPAQTAVSLSSTPPAG